MINSDGHVNTGDRTAGESSPEKFDVMKAVCWVKRPRGEWKTTSGVGNYFPATKYIHIYTLIVHTRGYSLKGNQAYTR
jgi:hypothetical protein